MNHVNRGPDGHGPRIELAGLVGRAGRVALGLGKTAIRAGIASPDLVMVAPRARAFVRNAPRYEELAADPIATGPIDYGDLSAPAEAGYPQSSVIFGDSIGFGHVTATEQHCITQVIAQDMELAMEAAGVVRPSDEEGEFAYWTPRMLARSGATTRDVLRQIDAFRSEAQAVAPYDGPFTFEVSTGGGNDALAFLRKHLSPEGIALFLTDFHADFLPYFRSQCEQIVRSLVDMRQLPSLGGLEHVIVMGIPDIGRSPNIPIFRAPGARGIASAACRYMNAALLDVVREVQRTTSVQIHVQLIPPSTPLTGIHPNRKGYWGLAAQREMRCVCSVNGEMMTFWDLCNRHGIGLQFPEVLPTELPAA